MPEDKALSFGETSHNIACSINYSGEATFLVLTLGVYIICSIPFGLILSKAFGYGDIRSIGSGNIGATNVLRTGNKFLAILTLLLDAMKGAIPLILLIVLPLNGADFYRDLAAGLPEFCSTEKADFLKKASHFEQGSILFYGIFAILGHCFPVWLKFKGGKGVATAIGALLSAVPITGLVVCVTWLLTAFAFKMSSLAALVALGIAPLSTYFIYGDTPALICFIISLIVWFRHKENIKRLLKGEEPKIGQGKKAQSDVDGETS